MSKITIPGYIHEITKEDKTKVEDLFFKFNNARRRAYSMKQKDINKSYIEKTLQEEIGLNCRYVKDAYHFVKDLPSHVTFGGLKNQRLREKDKINKEEYRRRRNSIIISRGDKTRNGNLNLRVNLTEGRLRISTIKKREWIEVGLFIPKKYLKNYGHLLDGSKPYTVLVKRRNNNKGYDIRISLDVPARIKEAKGVMALDINAGHIDFAVMNKQNKKLITVGKINLHETQFVKTNKRDNILHKTADKIGNMARHYDADVVVGNLNTGKFKSRNRKVNRKIKNMPQYKFRQILKKLERRGITVREHSEACTTVLGRELAPLMGLDIHKASAIAFCLKFTDYQKFVELLSGVRSNEGNGSLRNGQKKGSELTAPCQSNLAGDEIHSDRCYSAIPGSWGLSAYADSLKTDFACLQVRMC